MRQPVSADGRVVHVLPYDEKPGTRCIENVAPDLMPDPGRAAGGRTMPASVCRDYEHGRRGTVSLLCAIDLLDGTAHHSVRRRHASAAHAGFLGGLDDFYPEGHVIGVILDNHSVHTSRETQPCPDTVPGRFEFVFTPTHTSRADLVEGFFSTITRQLPGGMRCSDRDEARDRIGRWFEPHNSRVEKPRHWTWGIDGESHDLDEVDVRDADLGREGGYEASFLAYASTECLWRGHAAVGERPRRRWRRSCRDA